MIKYETLKLKVVVMSCVRSVFGVRSVGYWQDLSKCSLRSRSVIAFTPLLNPTLGHILIDFKLSINPINTLKLHPKNLTKIPGFFSRPYEKNLHLGVQSVRPRPSQQRFRSTLRRYG